MAADYPTSVKSFSTKVDNVDLVMAADINDIQTEVAAIETQLVTSKLATLAAAPAANKVLTTDGSGNPTWAIQAPIIGCSVYAETQSITTATWTSVAFANENFDTDTMHDAVTNNERITINTAGIYLFTVNINFDYGAGTMRCVRLTKNGTNTQVMRENKAPTNSAGFSDVFNMSVILSCSVNDYFIVRVYQNSGGAININSTYPLQFGAIRIA